MFLFFLALFVQFFCQKQSYLLTYYTANPEIQIVTSNLQKGYKQL